MEYALPKSNMELCQQQLYFNVVFIDKLQAIRDLFINLEIGALPESTLYEMYM